MTSGRRALLASLAGAGVASAARAQNWPTQPLRAIVPFGAGSTTDIVPRAVFEHLSPQLGQPIIIENRAGAGGTIGSLAVARAPADGYTMLVNSSAHSISPALYPTLAYDPARDFAAVIPLGISPAVLVVSPAKGFRTAADLATAARARPGVLNFSSVGVGSATHVSAERFVRSAGIQAVHVPFRGGAEAMTEVIAGRIDFFFGPVGLVLPNIRDGKLAALVVNGDRRTGGLPDVPTTAEAGFHNAEYPIWFGVFLPAATPRPIVEALHGDTAKVLQMPRLRDRLADLGVDPMPMTPAEFDARVVTEIALNRTLVASAGIRVD
jgi:tripartite-type tricarboxylate transporter receptor subunit TctC